MATYERSRETTASPDQVWRFWSDTDTWPSWNPDVRAISLNGPFQSGTTGSMTTGRGTHPITLENVTGRSFDLVTQPMPATVFRFSCRVDPSPAGSRISQGLSMSGALAPIFGPLMGKRIAASFDPILVGLATAAQSGPAAAAAATPPAPPSPEPEAAPPTAPAEPAAPEPPAAAPDGGPATDESSPEAP